MFKQISKILNKRLPKFFFSKLGIVIVFVFALTSGYFAWDAFGGTIFGVTLRSNPNLENGLVAHWTFDGKDMKENAKDSSGNGNNGSLLGFTSTTTDVGVLGQALEFDGTDDYVNIGDIGTGIQTVAFWVKPDSASEKIIDLNGQESGSSSDTTFKSPSATGDDHNQWTNSTGAYSQGGSFAYPEGFNYKQDYYNFTFGIPVGATINGIEVQVRQHGADIGGNSDIYVDISHDGGTTYESDQNMARTTNNEPAWDDITLGGSTDTWGRSWSDTEFSNTNFRLRVDSKTSPDQPGMDHIQVKVYYTESMSSINTEVTNGYISATGFTSPTVYVNGSASSTLIAGNWYHVAITTGTGFYASSTNIGRISSTYFNGRIDDTRIYNRVLLATEISRLYHLGATTKIAETITTNPDLENGLVGHWTFDGKDMRENVKDSSGSGNNGYLINFTSTTTDIGPIGQALEFDGSDDYVDAGDINDLDGTAVFTMSAWMKKNTTGSSVPLEKGPSTSNKLGINFSYDGNLYLNISNGANIWANMTYNNTDWHHITMVYDGNQSGNANVLKGYIDGVEQTFSYSGTIPSTTDDNSSDFVIGRSPVYGLYADGLIDDVRIYNRTLTTDEISRLYHLGATTKIAETITTNPDLENGLVGHWTFDGKDMRENVKDSSGSGNTGYLIDITATSTNMEPGVIGQAILFPEANDLVIASTTGVNTAGGALNTVAFWMHMSSVNPSGSGGAVPFFFGEFGSHYSLWTGASHDCFGFNTYNGDALGVSITGLTDRWVHVVAEFYNGVASASNNKLYIDDVEQSISYCSGSSSISRTVEDNIRIGSNSTYPFTDSMIDDVRIYNRALTTDEISRLYDLGR